MNVIPVLETLRQRASETPDAPAILAPGRPPATFAALASNAEKLSQSLRAAGLGTDDVLAAALPDDATTLCAFLGVCPATAFAPLNPDLREAEFESAFKDLRPSALLVMAGSPSCSVSAARGLGIPVLEAQPGPQQGVGLFALSPGAVPAKVVRTESQPSTPALFLQTSATTGRAKFACLTHSNLTAMKEIGISSTLLNPADRMLSMMPLFHLQGLGTAYVQVLLGGSVVCAWPFDARNFLSWMQDFQPTWYTAVPTLHRAILALLREHPEVRDGLRLRFVRSIGSALPSALLRELEETLRVPVVEGYGMTEAGMVTGTPVAPYRPKPGSAGIRITPGVEIADEAGNLLPAGREGEIVLRGPNVTSEYRNAAEATRAAFRDGWFRTGDLGRFDDEGYLFITGRIKEIVNRGGEKILPGEIDDALLTHPAVAEAAAFGIAHAQLGEDLAAAIVLRNGASASESAFRDFLGTRLAAFKIPRVLVFRDRLPRSASGKVQRWRLAQDYAEAQRARQAAAPAQPVTEDQAKLVEIWAAILRIPAPGIDDDFFELGGDSLTWTQVLGRVERSFGIALPYDAVLSAPTIRRLSAALQTSATIRKQIVAIQPAGGKPPFFMIRPLPIFRPLASRLPIDRPFLGVVVPGPKEVESGGADLQGVARQLVSAVRLRQPSGPYYLGGWCADGVLAFEMAQQLTAAGEEVGLVALFDVLNPARLRARSSLRLLGMRLGMVRWRVRFQTASILRLGRKEALAYIAERIVAAARFLGDTIRGASVRDTVRGKYHPSGVRPRIGGYRPKPYAGAVVVFRTGRSRQAEAGTSVGWDEFVRGSLTLIPVPGDHLTMFLEPNVDVLARELARCLERAEAATGVLSGR